VLLIPCPWCGPRNEDEFVCGGEAERRRPTDPDVVDDSGWADYLYHYDNRKGPVRERWWHSAGCNRWFEIERDTATHAIRPPADGDGWR
jgi:heterotetrameric sarcosine oxidase delta subunit